MKYFFLALFSVSAFGNEIICPPELKTEQNSVDAPKGWKVYEEKFNTRHLLSGVDFYSGHPDEGNRIPSENNTWKFDKKDQVTVVCRYAHTLLTLTQELKNKVNCDVVMEKEKPKKINCR